MDANKLKAEHKWVRDQLDNVTEFWMKNGWDREHGGVSTCLDRFGRLFMPKINTERKNHIARTVVISRLCRRLCLI